MELKQYQKQVLNDLSDFLDVLQEKKAITESYNTFWQNNKRIPLIPSASGFIKPYNDSIQGVPHVCFKVPTAGGKTFIAASSLKVIYDHFSMAQKKAVVWLVPSDAILEQTAKNLKDTAHPYRQKITIDFSGKVEVYEKKELLSARGFNANSVDQNLSIFVLSFDSLRTKNKDGRKVYQDNGALQSFAHSLKVDPSSDDEITLMQVIQSLNPVVIVDESHNARSDLSLEMLKDLHPSFILDLTATPRENSNIISFVPAMELKNANMVKLPVIVSNHESKEAVISCALHLRAQLETLAKVAQKNKTDEYIRPIILFQAQPKTADDNTTFDKIKAILIKLKIKEEEIKIKTSDRNELKGIDLASPSCKVRYIITVNALKEGWDCPFAYILASLADRSANVDVEQILGRVLRLPYVRSHSESLLNMSYVFTSSAKFLNTLQNIVAGLNAAGFTEKDYRVAEPILQPELTNGTAPVPYGNSDLFGASIASDNTGTEADAGDFTLDVSQIVPPPEHDANVNNAGVSAINDATNATSHIAAQVAAITQKAIAEDASLTQAAAQAVADVANGNVRIPAEMEKQVMKYDMKDVFKDTAQNVQLPQFSEHHDLGDAFNFLKEEDLLFSKETLLKKFLLNQCDININFAAGESQLYRVDLDQQANDTRPVFLKINGDSHDRIMRFIMDPKQHKNRVDHATDLIMHIVGKMYPIPDSEIRAYIERILSCFTEEQFMDFSQKEYLYADLIKQKITSLGDEYVEKQFSTALDTDKIQMNLFWKLPASISPVKTAPALPKSLYEKEGDINGFELDVINEVANMENVAWWTRNIEKRGFCINGFINHYPDFIICTKKGKIVLLETKGDHLDAERKITLGNLWASKAGNNYRYFLVYDKRQVSGSKTRDEFMKIMRDL